MRKMRVEDDPGTLKEKIPINDQFLWCRKQSNRPRIHYTICERCSLKSICRDYKSFLSENGIELKTKTRKKKRKKSKRKGRNVA